MKSGKSTFQKTGIKTRRNLPRALMPTSCLKIII
jgi:hypothetical protein